MSSLATKFALIGLTFAVVARSASALVASWTSAEPAWAPWLLAVVAVAVGVWRVRRSTPAAPAPIAPWAAAMGAVAGAALHAIGARAGDPALVSLALPPLMLGAACLVSPRAGHLWPSALLLLVATPLPPGLVLDVVQALKSSAAHVAAVVLSLGGTPAWSDGWVIRVPRGELRVIDACSGARTWIGLVVAAAVLLHVRPASLAVRWATVLACLPAAFVATVLRLSALGGAVAVHGAKSEPYRAMHDAAGLLVVVPGVLLLLAARWSASLFEPRDAPPPVVSTTSRPPVGAVTALVALALLVGALPSPPCPCRPLELPATLDGAPARAAEGLGGVEALNGARCAAATYGEPGAALTVVAVHAHDLGGPRGVHARAPEWLPPFCHAALASEPIELPGGVIAQRLLLARDDARRVAFAVWLDADGRPVAASLPAAWRAAVVRGALGRPVGGTLLVCWSDDLGDDPRRVEREATRVAHLLDALGVRAVGG